MRSVLKAFVLLLCLALMVGAIGLWLRCQPRSQRQGTAGPG